MNCIKITIRSDKKVINAFLEELREVVSNKDFNIDDNLIIIKSSKEEIEYSTGYTIVDLDYDSKDIIARLKELSIVEYSKNTYR